MAEDDTEPQPSEHPPDAGTATDDTEPEMRSGSGEPKRVDALAVVGCILGFVFWPAGLPLSMIARRRIRRTEDHGGDLATIGVVVGAAEASVSIVLALSLWAMMDRAADIAERPFDTFERTSERMIETQERFAEGSTGARAGGPSGPPPRPTLPGDDSDDTGEANDWFERTSDRMMDDFEQRANRMDESFERSSERMHDDFEERSDEMHEDFERRSDEMDERFEERSQRMDEWFERESRRMHGDSLDSP